MSKHKKTRKQKIIADYRHNVYSLQEENEKSFSPNKSINTPTAIIDNNPYSYIAKDVLKTGILTASIIAGQLILFFLLKNHIITIPWISY